MESSGAGSCVANCDFKKKVIAKVLCKSLVVSSMINPNLNVEALRALLALYDRREELQKELDSIDNQIANILAGKKPGRRIGRRGASKANAGRKPERVVKSREVADGVSMTPEVSVASRATGKRRMKTVERVLRALKSAGPEGLSVKEIAQKIKSKPESLHVWFSTTGSKMPEIKRIARGRYAAA